MPILDFELFVQTYCPQAVKKYEIYCLTDEQLVGRIVYADRSGFSCGSEGGTPMIIERIDNTHVHFIPVPGTGHDGQRGWGCERDQLISAIRLTKDR